MTKNQRCMRPIIFPEIKDSVHPEQVNVDSHHLHARTFFAFQAQVERYVSSKLELAAQTNDNFLVSL